MCRPHSVALSCALFFLYGNRWQPLCPPFFRVCWKDAHPPRVFMPLFLSVHQHPARRTHCSLNRFLSLFFDCLMSWQPLATSPLSPSTMHIDSTCRLAIHDPIICINPPTKLTRRAFFGISVFSLHPCLLTIWQPLATTFFVCFLMVYLF